jgi:hypothetical protein
MACNTCHQLTEVPECSSTLNLGTLALLNTELYIYVKNLHSGYVHKQEAISSGAGLVTLNTTEPSKDFYNKDYAYEIWVTLRTNNDRVNFTINTVVLDCFNPSFHQVNSFYELP